MFCYYFMLGSDLVILVLKENLFELGQCYLLKFEIFLDNWDGIINVVMDIRINYLLYNGDCKVVLEEGIIFII